MNRDEATRLWAIVIRLSRKLNATAADEGLTPTESSVLALLVRDGPLTIGFVTKYEGLHPTMVSRVVGRLVRLGLISRTQDRSDQRTAIVTTTVQGHDVVRRIRAARSQIVGTALDRLPAGQQSNIIRAIAALEDFSRTLDEDPSL
ncbi:MAG TPA: MarR family transcriptional regulator [Galbitalea sp.]